MSTENYYIPYCNRCNKYVRPQVVSSTHVHGAAAGVWSTVSHEKMCPECGEQVFSQSDVDAYNAKQKALGKTINRLWVIVGVAIGGFILLVMALWAFFLWYVS